MFTPLRYAASDVPYKEYTYPNVKFSRPNPFWNANCIYNSTKYVTESHKNEPTQGCVVYSLIKAIRDNKVQGRDDAT